MSGAQRVLLAVSEAYPLMKTGGLGDAVISLAVALRAAGVDARLVMPAYREAVQRLPGPPARVGTFPLPGHAAAAQLYLAEVPTTTVPVYLFDVAGLFDRPGGPYADVTGATWPDNAARFAAFGHGIAALGSGRADAAWRPQVLHCNDWHTGLAPPLLAGQAERPAIVFCIHSLAHQGLFPRDTFRELALPDAWWSPEALEFYDQMSFLKGGLVFADQWVTVSPSYAGEILTPAYGWGLDGFLRHHRRRLRGILNGVNYAVWDPRHDPEITRSYGVDSLADKRLNKHALQRELGLDQSAGAFVIAYVGRLAEQKGIDLVIDALPQVLDDPRVQIVMLGDGEPRFEQGLAQAAAAWPGRLALRLGYAESLAHRIEAGADAFLMPSRFEPCGLTQLYSLRYGTVPMVAATGGLRDTVVDFDRTGANAAAATGFVFDPHDGMLAAVGRARDLFFDAPAQWRRLMTNGMLRDFSWDRSVDAYRAVYAQALRDRTMDEAAVSAFEKPDLDQDHARRGSG